MDIPQIEAETARKLARQRRPFRRRLGLHCWRKKSGVIIALFATAATVTVYGLVFCS
jgi:hypothetical protein